MHTIPKADRERITLLLSALPGFEGRLGRKNLLSLVWPSNLTDFSVGDREVEAGWAETIASVSRLPSAQSTEILRALLLNIKSALPDAGTTRDIAREADRLATLATDRSFATFLARLDLDSDEGQDNGIFVLDNVFVPPVQYKRAVEILKSERVVFILGDPHMGKTYSALHLLWENFRDRGAEPYWLKSPTELNLRQPVSGSPVPDGAILYIEDPFGRTSPIDDPEIVFASLRRLITEADKRRLLIVVTSRTAVLQAAIADRLQDNVVTLSQELRVDNSYDHSDLLAIATKYLAAYRPLWAENEVAADIAETICRELVAPHNIQEFVLATRNLTTTQHALGRLSDFDDVIAEYASAFKKMDDWIVTALLVLAAASGLGMDFDGLSTFYNRLNPNRPQYKSFKAAVDALGSYLTFASERRPVLRHPSLEEAVEALCRQRTDLTEATWILVVACGDQPGFESAIIATGLLIRYADRWARTDGRLAVLDGYFDHWDLRVRSASRRLALNRLSDLVEAAAGLVAEIALRSWGDRFLIQLILSPSALADGFYAEVALKLSRSIDGRTRYMLAEHVGNLRETAALEICRTLMSDADGLVAREAIYRALDRWPIEMVRELGLAQALDSLAPRHRNWLEAMTSKHVR